MATTKTFWLSYDLGLKGDYQGLYRWLDNNKARECGGNIAVFKKDDSGDVIKDIETDISRNVEFNPSDRVYLIWKDSGTDKTKGKFLKGKRKPAPWEGYSDNYQDTQEDSE